MQQNLFITNTLTRKSELFVPIDPNRVTMYVCGITPYDLPHMGHGRVYVIFDVVYRLLNFLGYKVLYARNFTDIDEKSLNKAKQEFGDQMRYLDVANRYIAIFEQNMTALNCVKPTYEPRVTETMPEIISFIQGLIKEGSAYVTADGDVYFDINADPSYGILSHRKLDDLVAGARVEINLHKKNPLDFALWKSSETGTFWAVQWPGHEKSWGRPGWHIECSAMIEQYLKSPIDIHGGGMDLIFPHHENEIAQTQGLFHHQLARYWMHVAFVTVNKEKMSKSLGNFFTLNQLFEKVDPMVVRYYYLQHQMQGPMEFSLDDIAQIQKGYERLLRVFSSCAQNHLDPLTLSVCESGSPNEAKLFGVKANVSKGSALPKSPIVHKMLNVLCTDLNFPGMWGVLFENIHILQENEPERNQVYAFLRDVLGFTFAPLPEKKVAITPEIQKLIDDRETARKEKDWKRSDELRDQLRELGYEPQDKRS